MDQVVQGHVKETAEINVRRHVMLHVKQIVQEADASMIALVRAVEDARLIVDIHARAHVRENVNQLLE